eukprot:6183618-Pleurochrysis_carterae.AAC.2
MAVALQPKARAACSRWLLKGRCNMDRKFEPDRLRSTTDARAPRKRQTDGAGVPVPSINDLSGQFPHPLEQKRTPRDLANDLALLNHAAQLTGDDVFIVTDDVADYFPYLSLTPTDY